MERVTGTAVSGEADPRAGDSITEVAQTQHPDSSLSRFVEQVDRRFRQEQVESFWGLEEEFRQLAHSGFVPRLINDEIARIAHNPSYMGDWRSRQFMLHRGKNFALSVWLVDDERRYIHSSPSLCMYAPIGPESLRYDVYKLPGNYRNSVFDPGVKLEPAGSGITGPGGILLLQSDRFVYDFKAKQPLAVLKFASSPLQAMEWLFNKDNLHAWQANDGDPAWTQLRIAAHILGRLANQSSLEPLEQLSSHPHHAVRWAAIQNIGRLSRRAAMPRLEQAVNDPHPHVRRAAANMLQQANLKKSRPE